ncbi:hypothetical protein RHMOL_Rhmol01G0168300 [Rhododendron molle]|uniref:Uncharacterized protein n=1 Tax=Rhododendron molle TaxID=49168 RepID=A0ACC0Q2J2_RHOML|nr:hypothetical protein RHMOL_Rhmol01G0168300 [Rhododendron molle]
MDDSLKGRNVVIDISDGASDDDGHSNDDGYGDDDGHRDDDRYGVNDELDDYRLDELTEEDVYEMIFNSDEDGERFYNAYAKVKGFSVQKDNIHKDNEAQRKIEVADGEAEGALAYLCAKAEYDPLFYYKYDVDEKNQLNNLFWRDSTSLTDYMYFGDVLLFDATYRTNAYGKPFVILARVNSHFQTMIFGCALLTAETVETYTWHAADTFSRAICKKFCNEIKKEQSLFRVDKVEIEDFQVYYLSRYQQKDATWSVYYQPTEGIVKCSCSKFESIGFPGCHMISVMKMEHLREIPSYLISQRWTKMAKSSSLHGRTPMPEWVTKMTRYGALSTTCVEMAFYASHSTNAYDEAREEIARLTFKMRELYMLDVQSKQKATGEENNVEGTSMHFGIGDPVIIKHKGSQNLAKDFIPRVRKCGHCRLPGHM